ncbi:hypothetical protein GJAV_G00171580 [Gymnothorax javanicus]|nr:hypothetical protein GJAV_G00171580 [Gymnothorax javanicus]
MCNVYTYLQLVRRQPPKICVSKEGASCKIREINAKHPSMPVNVPALSKALKNHPNRCFVNYLITGLVQGFLAGLCWLPTTTHVCKNLQTAVKEPKVVDELLEKETKKGFMIGPFSKSPFSLFRVSPIGVATRKYSGKKRLIIDLSAPHNGPVPSINSLIPLAPFSLFYATVDNAIQMIKSAGQGAWLGKADITDAFKVMPLHPSQWHLFGVKWRSKLYFAVKLTFGCRSSPRIFDTLSEALCWILYNTYKLPFVLHLLDDFLVVDFPVSPPARCITAVRNVFSSLGVPLSEEKTVGPSTRIEFLGIALDSVLMQASLPEEKLCRMRDILKAFSSATSVLKRDLLSLLGHLNFAMRIIPQGRSFVSRLLDLSKTVKDLHDDIILDQGCLSDIRFWSLFLDQWNGISFFYKDVSETSASIKLFTDAAPSVGFGGFVKGEWFSEAWPKEMLDLPPDCKSIALFELYPIVVAALLWGNKWSRKQIVVLCDNEATVNMINRGALRRPQLIVFSDASHGHA